MMTLLKKPFPDTQGGSVLSVFLQGTALRYFSVFRRIVAMGAFGFLCVMGMVPAYAMDIENGKSLHDANCRRCHQESMYTREVRLVHSYQGLRDRISQCELSSGLNWFEEDVDDVTAYLNRAFYQFVQE